MSIFCGRRYVITLALWMGLYAVLLFTSIGLTDARLVEWLPLRVIVALAPMVAGFGVLNLIMHRYRAGDELQQRIVAESIMFAFGATAILTFSYGLLQRMAGAPALSYLWVWAVLGCTWVIGSAIARLRYR
jgi:hypothetical protein